ncbi:MAG: PDZ domain-containing protein [Gemmatimonadota bacterium]
MRFAIDRWNVIAIAALAATMAWPGAADAQRRDRDSDDRDEFEIHIGELGNELRDVMRQMRLRVSRAQLGVSVDDDDLGARIVRVLDDSPAEAAGLEEGDIIVALDGVDLTGPIEDEDDDDDWGPTMRLVHLLGDVEPGDVVGVDYSRDGQRASVDVETTSRRTFAVFSGSPRISPRSFIFRPNVGGVFRFRDSSFGFFGAHLADVNDQLGSYFGVEQGALVLDVDDDDDGLGLRPGDVIVEVGGRDIRDASDAYRILGSYEEGERLRVVVVRAGERVTLEQIID